MDDSLIQTSITRGVERVFPSREALEARLRSGAKLRIYHGIDPTGPTLHIGHAATLLKLRDFQQLGHEIVLLIGGFTATIGDPSDKGAARKKLTLEQVEENAGLYREQAGRVLDMSTVEFRNNAEWYKTMSFADALELASEFTVHQLLERDMFQKRIEKKEPVYLHELIYPAMQGYDSMMLNVDMEVGGNDQTFNMLAGRDLLMRRGKEKFVVAGKLLTDPTGKKMGKTEGNMVALNDSPENMYGKVMSWPDTLMSLAFEVCTRVSQGEAREAIATSPRDAKMRLAREIVEQFGGKGKAVAAEVAWAETFQKGGVPEDAPVALVSEGSKLFDILNEHGLVGSRAQWRRLVDEGAVHILSDDGEEMGRVSDYEAEAPVGVVIKIGKLRFLKIEAA